MGYSLQKSISRTLFLLDAPSPQTNHALPVFKLLDFKLYKHNIGGGDPPYPDLGSPNFIGIRLPHDMIRIVTFVSPFCIPRVMGAIESLGCNYWNDIHQIDA